MQAIVNGKIVTPSGVVENQILLFQQTVVGIESALPEGCEVIDATTGQNGLAQAKVFSDVANIEGIVLTKLDGTAKGGIAVAIANELHMPVRYIGLGEQIDDLQPFDAKEFIDAILG